MYTTQNALYKLLHDARRKLKRQMEAAGPLQKKRLRSSRRVRSEGHGGATGRR